jgi:hypothetical protein
MDDCNHTNSTTLQAIYSIEIKWRVMQVSMVQINDARRKTLNIVFGDNDDQACKQMMPCIFCTANDDS